MSVMLENKLDDVNAKIDETNMLKNELKGYSFKTLLFKLPNSRLFGYRQIT